MLHFYSLMTFLQSNSKQAWKRDHNIGLFVTFIQPAALTWLCYLVLPYSLLCLKLHLCFVPVMFLIKVLLEQYVFFICFRSLALMWSAGHSNATWVCWRREQLPSTKCAPASGPRPSLRLVGEEPCYSNCLDMYCTWTCVSSRGKDWTL